MAFLLAIPTFLSGYESIDEVVTARVKLLHVIDGFRSSLSSGVSLHLTGDSFFANSVSKLRDRSVVLTFCVLNENNVAFYFQVSAL